MKFNFRHTISILLLLNAIMMAMLFVKCEKQNPNNDFSELNKNLETIYLNIDSVSAKIDFRNKSIDSIVQTVESVSVYLASIQKEKEALTNQYKTDLSKLNGISIDSLKNIALQE